MSVALYRNVIACVFAVAMVAAMASDPGYVYAKDECDKGAILLKADADAQCRIDAKARSRLTQFVANIRALGRQCPAKQPFVVRAIEGNRFEAACDLSQASVRADIAQRTPRWISCGQFSASIQSYGFVDDFDRKQGLWNTKGCGSLAEGYEMYKDGALMRSLRADDQRVQQYSRDGQNVVSPSATGFDGYESADRK